jgi:hypothetical protein
MNKNQAIHESVRIVKTKNNCRCKDGRGFYQTEVDPETHCRYIEFCDHEPASKYKRMCETIKRIQAYEPSEEEVQNCQSK